MGSRGRRAGLDVDLSRGAPAGWAPSSGPLLPGVRARAAAVPVRVPGPRCGGPVAHRGGSAGETTADGAVQVEIAVRAPRPASCCCSPSRTTSPRRRSSLPGIVREGTGLRRTPAAPAGETVFSATLPAAAAGRLGELRVGAIDRGLPGGQGWLRQPAWLGVRPHRVARPQPAPGRAGAGCTGATVTLDCVTITSNDVTRPAAVARKPAHQPDQGGRSMDNPFVYGEVVPAAAFVDRDGRAEAPVRPTWRRARRCSSSRPAGTASRRSSAARSHRSNGDGVLAVAGDRLELQLVSRVPRGLRPGGAVGDDAVGASGVVDPRGARRRAAGGAARDRRSRRGRLRGRVPRGAHASATCRASRRRSTSCRRGSPTCGRRRVVVALDEFQAIGAFNGGSVEEALRAAVQHQRQVGYVFAGSEPTLMERMIGPKRPFYKAGPVMRLEKIPPDIFARVHRLAVHAVRHPRRAGFRRGACSSSPASCPTTSSGWRTRRGTMPARRAGGRWGSTTCTRRCGACSPSRRSSSRAPGSG